MSAFDELATEIKCASLDDIFALVGALNPKSSSDLDPRFEDAQLTQAYRGWIDAEVERIKTLEFAKLIEAFLSILNQEARAMRLELMSDWDSEGQPDEYIQKSRYAGDLAFATGMQKLSWRMLCRMRNETVDDHDPLPVSEE